MAQDLKLETIGSIGSLILASFGGTCGCFFGVLPAPVVFGGLVEVQLQGGVREPAGPAGVASKDSGPCPEYGVCVCVCR